MGTTKSLQEFIDKNPDSRGLIDLVVLHLGPKMTVSWLNGHNAHLDGARPIDVLMLRGVSEVIDAFEIEISGSYA